VTAAHLDQTFLQAVVTKNVLYVIQSIFGDSISTKHDWMANRSTCSTSVHRSGSRSSCEPLFAE